jgi:hypothetical protein
MTTAAGWIRGIAGGCTVKKVRFVSSIRVSHKHCESAFRMAVLYKCESVLKRFEL